MINNNSKIYLPLSEFIIEYSERNTENKYSPVAVGKYGIRRRESIYSKELASEYSKNKLIYKNTLTVGMGSKQIDVGVLIDDITYSVSPAYHTYKIANINSKYLDYCIQCRNQDMFTRFVKRGSRQGKTVDLKRWLTYEIPVYNEASQAEIVEHLNRAQSLIELRQKQLEKIDELIKARFVELFGTLDNPNQEFAKATLKELCNKITDGKHGGCKAEEGTERYFVGAREIYDDEVHYDTAPEINIDEFEKDYKRCNIEIGDFLIVNTGATIGKSAIATDERTEHTLLQKSVALLKVKKEVLNPVFLKWCYRVNTQMYIVESASAQPNLLLSKINATVIYVPNIELQNQFVSFVEQVDKSKVVDTNIIPEGGFYYGDKFFIS